MSLVFSLPWLQSYMDTQTLWSLTTINIFDPRVSQPLQQKRHHSLATGHYWVSCLHDAGLHWAAVNQSGWFSLQEPRLLSQSDDQDCYHSIMTKTGVTISCRCHSRLVSQSYDQDCYHSLMTKTGVTISCRCHSRLVSQSDDQDWCHSLMTKTGVTVS